MNNPFSNLLTKNEQKVLGYLAALLIAGLGLSYTGVSTMYAAKPDIRLTELEQATEVDSTIRIDIRTADQDELILLPGIGEKRAAIIIAYRQAKQFESAEELLNIKGIGAKTFLKMQPMLLPFGKSGQGVLSREKLSALAQEAESGEPNYSSSGKQELDATAPPAKTEQSNRKNGAADDQSKVNLNTAGLQELQSLSGIGPVKAQAILDYRKQVGRFTSLEQLLDVKGIGPKTLDKNRHRLNL